MELAGSGGIYEILLIILVVILIFNGLKRQKIMNKVDSNLNSNSGQVTTDDDSEKKPETIDGEYVDFEETTD
jgi:hypothetical protein